MNKECWNQQIQPQKKTKTKTKKMLYMLNEALN
jgi:hypothetical protein